MAAVDDVAFSIVFDGMKPALQGMMQDPRLAHLSPEMFFQMAYTVLGYSALSVGVLTEPILRSNLETSTSDEALSALGRGIAAALQQRTET
jgi:hypothetical protein